MRLKKDTWLILGFLAAALWMLVISFAILEIYATQDYFGKALVDIWNEIDEMYDYILEPFNATQVSLSDETQGLVEDLRRKHYPFFYTGDTLYFTDITWTSDFLSIKVEGNELIIETQDGKWFIEMQRKEE